ncbi:MAG: hypothetical protein HZA53_09540, partial [Planctomycetes bacterium]|nr:hypothetical protein [Planctomycetota bacterium]
MPPTPSAPRVIAGSIVALTVLALVLRLACIDRLLPHAPEPDAFLVGQMLELRGEPAPGEHADHWERYPLLFAALMAATPAATTVALDELPREPRAAERALRA